MLLSVGQTVIMTRDDYFAGVAYHAGMRGFVAYVSEQVLIDDEDLTTPVCILTLDTGDNLNLYKPESMCGPCYCDFAPI